MNAATAAPVFAALQLPRTLFAEGALAMLPAELAALGVRRPLLVTDQGVVAAGIAAKALEAYGRGGEMSVFDAVTENPLFADVDDGAAFYRQERCDGVVALGGGSVIDTAKLIALLATNGGSASDFVGVPQVPHVASAALVAIPTTAGTGSEASASAAVHRDATTAAVGMQSRHLVPAVALLDPRLTQSLPCGLTAATGIDALSHCIEGYLSRKSVPLGDAIALEGLDRLKDGREVVVVPAAAASAASGA